jgi:hypothetical protein
MNEGQLKSRIFLLQTLDWVLFLTVTGIGTYAVLHTERVELTATVALVALLIVAKLGDVLRQKAAALKGDLKIEERRMGKKHI